MRVAAASTELESLNPAKAEEQRRRDAWDQLWQMAEGASARAQAKGFTEAKLAEILNEIKAERCE